MKIPERFYVTPYYRDKEQHNIDTAPLFQSSHTAYNNRRAQNNFSESILTAWASTCREVVNTEAKLAMTFMGQLLLETYLELDKDSWNSGIFPPWVEAIYFPCAEHFYWKSNNQGSWGILGCILADKILNRDYKQHESRLRIHMAHSWDSSGVMTEEVKRTNSGIWYSYFSLAPLLRACQLLETPLIDLLCTPLSWLFYYAKYPQKWPYRPGQGLWKWFGWLQKFLYPYSDELDLPHKNDWPGNLFLAAGNQFDNELWKAYAERPFNDGIHIFKESYFSGD